MSEKEKKEEFRRSDIYDIARPAIKLAIVICLPWILISKLDKLFDRDSEEGFEPWNFYWSFPATHLSWLVLTLLFGLPLCGLLGAPIVLPVCVVTGVTSVGLLTIVLAGVVIAVIWFGLYHAVHRYHSLREISEVRREVFDVGDERGELRRDNADDA